MTDTTWNPTNIGDLEGRTYLVTGANGGIGYHASAQLLRAGAAVIMAARNPDRLDAAVNAICSADPSAADRIQRLCIDISSVSSSIAAAEHVASSSLNGLLLNAGLVKGPKTRTVTPEGHELLFATNILGHFAFAGTILSRLSGESPRIVWMGSSTAIKGHYDFTDPEVSTGYAPMKAYANSKAATTMVGVEAHRRLRNAGSPVVSVIAHPGYSLGGRGPRVSGVNEPSLGQRVMDTLQSPFSQTKEQGAHAPVRALVDPAVRGAEFVGPDGYKGPTVRADAPAYTTDEAAGRRLWEYLEGATNTVWP